MRFVSCAENKNGDGEMKKKFIMILAAVILVVALFAITLPAMSPDVDVGAAGVVASVEAADLAAMDSGTVLIIDNTAPAPASTAGGIYMWVALGATLVTLAVVSRRKLFKLYDFMATGLRNLNDRTDESTGTGRSPRDCIMPAAA